MKVFAGLLGPVRRTELLGRPVEILRPGTQHDTQRAHQELVDQGLIVWVTFHPSYSYEDFVEGFRPIETPEGNVTYSIVPARRF